MVSPLSRLAPSMSTRMPSAPISRPSAPTTKAPNATLSAWRGASDFEPAAKKGLPAGGIARNKVVDAGSTLTREAQEALAAGGVKNPTAAQVKDAVNAFSSTNALANPDRIGAGKSLAVPEDLRRGQLFHELARSVTREGDSLYGMPAAGFSTDTRELVEGADGLAGLAREVGPKGVAELFNDHMERTGRPFITMDTAQSTDRSLIFDVRNSRDHLGLGAGAGL